MRAQKGIAPARRRGNTRKAAIHDVNSGSIIGVRVELFPLIADKSLAAVEWETGTR